MRECEIGCARSMVCRIFAFLQCGRVLLILFFLKMSEIINAVIIIQIAHQQLPKKSCRRTQTLPDQLYLPLND